MTQGVYPRKSLEERFWSKVKKTNGCWIWTAGFFQNGYPQFWVVNTSVHANRIAYKLAYGVDPGDLMVCHKCDNKACVRPDHLFLGDAFDNMRDWSKKGLSYRGEKNNKAILTTEQVIRIKESLSLGVRVKDLAAEFGVDPTTIGKIKAGVNWKHICL